MPDHRASLRLAAAVDDEARLLRAAGHSPGLDTETHTLWLEETWASTLIAGSTLSLDETTTLVERGVATGDHRLDAYVLGSDYAGAARFVAGAQPPGRRRICVRLEEIVTLHSLAAQREPQAHPGAWRTTTARALPS